MFEVPHNIGLLQAPARFHSLQHGQHHQHKCSRFCSFEHIVGNVWQCTSSGTTHVCDSNCSERVQLDPYSSVCRLSKRVFSNNVQRAGPCRLAASLDVITDVKLCIS